MASEAATAGAAGGGRPDELDVGLGLTERKLDHATKDHPREIELGRMVSGWEVGSSAKLQALREVLVGFGQMVGINEQVSIWSGIALVPSFLWKRSLGMAAVSPREPARPRVSAYAFLLVTDRYPPFSLKETS